MVQAISASHMAEHKTEPELESDQEQLNKELLLHIESDTEWLDSPQQIYSVTISKFLTAAYFPLEIQGCKTTI